MPPCRHALPPLPGARPHPAHPPWWHCCAAWYRLGTALLGLGHDAEAEAAFQQGLKLKPNNKHLRDGLARAQAGSGAAAGGGEGSAENQSPAAATTAAGSAAAAAKGTGKGKGKGRPGSAAPAGSAPPTPESSDAGAATPAAAAAAPVPGAAAAAGGAGAPPQDAARQLAEAQKALGNEAFKAGRYEEAVRCFSAAVQLCPGTAVYHGNRAAACLMGKRYPEAVQDSLKAVQLDAAFVKGYARAGAGAGLGDGGKAALRRGGQ